jgi:hypothetical protein
MGWLSEPNRPHLLFPNRNRITTKTVDLTVGSEAECEIADSVNETDRCRECKANAGCNWCPSTCQGAVYIYIYTYTYIPILQLICIET